MTSKVNPRAVRAKNCFTIISIKFARAMIIYYDLHYSRDVIPICSDRSGVFGFELCNLSPIIRAMAYIKMIYPCFVTYPIFCSFLLFIFCAELKSD